MTEVLRRLALLVTTFLFVAAMVAVPVQLNLDNGKIENSVAFAGDDDDQGEDDDDQGENDDDQGDDEQ